MTGRRARRTHGSVAAIAVALVLIAPACRTPAAPPSVAARFATADSLMQAGRPDAAARLFRSLGDSLAAAGDTGEVWRARVWWADAQRRLGHSDSAASGFDAAEHLAGRDPGRMGWTTILRAQLVDTRGDLTGALALANRALTLARTSADRRLEAACYHEMARVHSLSGRYRDAYRENSAALRIYRAIGPPYSTALELNELVIDYRHLGRFTDALAASNESIRIHRSIGRTDAAFWVLGNTANVWRELGDPARALGVLSQAMKDLESASDLRPKGLGLQGMADLYIDQQMWARAEPYARQALALNRKAGLPYSETGNLIALGKIELAVGRTDSAGVFLRQALAIAGSIGYRREGVAVRALLTRFALGHGDRPGALRWSADAVALADSLGDPEARVEAREARGLALEPDRPRDAARIYLDAIDLLESWRGRLATGDLQWGVTQPWGGVYEGAIRSLFAVGDAAGAWQVAERARARLLLQLVTDREAGAAPQDAHARLLQELRDQYEILNGEGGAERAQADSAIDRIALSLDSMERNARQRDPAAGVRYLAAPDLARVRRDLLAGGRRMLVYFWGDSAVYGWAVSAASLRGVRLGRTDSLASIVRFFNGMLQQSSADSDWMPAARNVYARLVAPLLTAPGARVVVVADGPLTRIPFGALIPAESNQPWSATTEITYGPSAMVLTTLARLPHPVAWNRAILAVGDPTPRGSEPEADLPYAAAEARALGKMFPPGAGDVLVGGDATEARWISRDPSQYRYLHFASHAIADDRNPDRSRIVLADRDLDLPSIERLRLHSELVALSGCETALGKRVRGEGVIGLPYAFLAAGAHAVVVSLWRVDDRSTSEFMTDFYGRLRSGLSPAEALQATRQAWLRRAGDESHPERWAAFVLVGE